MIEINDKNIGWWLLGLINVYSLVFCSCFWFEDVTIGPNTIFEVVSLGILVITAFLNFWNGAVPLINGDIEFSIKIRIPFLYKLQNYLKDQAIKDRIRLQILALKDERVKYVERTDPRKFTHIQEKIELLEDRI